MGVVNVIADASARFWAKVDKSGGPEVCWPWTGARAGGGYGRFRVESRYSPVRGSRPSPVQSHRYAYEAVVGPIPDGLMVDHLCRNRACCNPMHLEPVTNRENLMRGVGVSAVAASKTHCPAGHPYSGDNLYVSRWGRDCRACGREYRRRKRAFAGDCFNVADTLEAAAVAERTCAPLHGTRYITLEPPK